MLIRNKNSLVQELVGNYKSNLRIQCKYHSTINKLSNPGLSMGQFFSHPLAIYD